MRDVIDTMDHVTTHIFEEKKKALASVLTGSLSKQDVEGAEAKDLIAILSKSQLSSWFSLSVTFQSKVRANMNANEEDRLPDKEVLAQVTFSMRNPDVKLLTHSSSRSRCRKFDDIMMYGMNP